MNWFQKIYYGIQISDNDKFLKIIDEKNTEIKNLALDTYMWQNKHNDVVFLNTQLVNESNILRDANLELGKKVPKLSMIENFCKLNYDEVPKIVYKSKRKINGKYYAISLHELITPDSYAINQFLKKCNILKSDDLYKTIYKIGDTLSKTLKWTDDKNLDSSGDYYLYPAETLTNLDADCEDHCLVMASCHPEIAGAWGFYNGGGHAFNCFVWNDELYILDTVGNSVVIEKVKGNKYYKICYIITKDHAYGLDKSVAFGQIAGWD